jgi:hypothetical protein
VTLEQIVNPQVTNLGQSLSFTATEAGDLRTRQLQDTERFALTDLLGNAAFFVFTDQAVVGRGRSGAPRFAGTFRPEGQGVFLLLYALAPSSPFARLTEVPAPAPSDTLTLFDGTPTADIVEADGDFVVAFTPPAAGFFTFVLTGVSNARMFIVDDTGALVGFSPGGDFATSELIGPLAAVPHELVVESVPATFTVAGFALADEILEVPVTLNQGATEQAGPAELGQTLEVTFEGAPQGAGEFLSVFFPCSFAAGKINAYELRDPDGVVIASGSCINNFEEDIPHVAGTYTLTVFPTASGLRPQLSIDVFVYDTPTLIDTATADVRQSYGPIIPGQEIEVTFDAPASNLFSLELDCAFAAGLVGSASVTDPQGTEVFNNSCQGSMLGPFPSQTGTWTVRHEPPQRLAGSMTLQINSMDEDPLDFAVTLNQGTGEGPGVIVPGQTLNYTFDHDPADGAFVAFGVTCNFAAGRVHGRDFRAPDDTQLAGGSCIGVQFVEPTPAQAGIYNLTILPANDLAISSNLRVYAYDELTLNVAAQANTLASAPTTAPGQTVTFESFDGAGPALDLDVTCNGANRMVVTDDVGTELHNGGCGDLTGITPATARFTVLLDANAEGTMNPTLTVVIP